MTNAIIIRPIKKNDNATVAKLIRDVLIEQNAPKTGTAFEDTSLDDLYKAYQNRRSVYYVMVENSKIIGGAGIYPIKENAETCELQKMYFLPQARGRGFGNIMIKKCLSFAMNNNYTACYIETLPSMQAAQKLYLKMGFKYIDQRLGQTEHHACTVWMLKHI